MYFFKRIKATLSGRKNQPSKAELESLVKYYSGLTAELQHKWALEKLDSEKRCHYLMLLKIADYHDMGKTFAILTAFKMGYLYAKGKIDLGVPSYYADAAYWAQEYRERTSEILAKIENADTLAQIYYFAKRAGKAGRHNDGK
ncbi:MAG: hypothetical protein HDR03_09410 [Lachnospiraceae bacterium]|nr:hypothetical protein [Lachnospiraceae bacterium]